MSKKTILYYGFVLIITNLFFQENMGLNAFIAAIFYVFLSAFHTSYEKTDTAVFSPKWLFAGSLFLLNGFAVYFSNGFTTYLFYFISLLYFSAVHHEIKISFPLGVAQSITSFFTGFYRYFESISKFEKTLRLKETKKMVTRLLVITIPLIIVITFLKLYQNADPTFYELTKFINLDWISWPFLGTYFLFFLSLFGIFYFDKTMNISNMEENLDNNISKSYGDKVQTFLGLTNEKTIALSLLITLNLMLLLYNGIDLHLVLIELPNPSPNISYIEIIHGGVGSLITSIILVMLIITFIYRGQLNFKGNKVLKILAIAWLSQNILMIITTSIKNYEYITHWGLTYKRIGVYIYLLFAAIGLAFTIIKILKIKSIWYLARNTSLSFIICFSFIGLFNWNNIIVNYNLSQLEQHEIDFDYLKSLGKDTYPALIDYHIQHKTTTEVEYNYEFWHHLFIEFDEETRHLSNLVNGHSWRSLNYRDSQLLKRMKSYNLIYKNKLEFSSL